MSTSQLPTEPGQFGPEEHSSQQQGTEYPQFPQPLILPPPPKKRSRRNLWITLAVFVVLLTSVRAISQSVTHTNPETQSTAAAVCIHHNATAVLFQQTAVAVSHVWMTTVAASTPAPTQVPVTPAQTFATITDGNIPGQQRHSAWHVSHTNGCATNFCTVLESEFASGPVSVIRQCRTTRLIADGAQE
jgi:hypothetical protein